MIADFIRVSPLIKRREDGRIRAFLTETLPTLQDQQSKELLEKANTVSFLHIAPYPGTISGVTKPDSSLYRIRLLHEGRDQGGNMRYFLQSFEDGMELHAIEIRKWEPKNGSKKHAE